MVLVLEARVALDSSAREGFLIFLSRCTGKDSKKKKDRAHHHGEEVVDWCWDCKFVEIFYCEEGLTTWESSSFAGSHLASHPRCAEVIWQVIQDKPTTRI